ncbi:MAG: FtsW/RodA/SpoVE family cell cycle protein [Alphaproteobacteria bacterium]
MRYGRSDRSAMAQWWWTIDRPMLAMVLVLAFAGLVLTLAASPSVAVRIGQPEYYFVIRHLLFIGPALGLLIGASLLEPTQIRRLSLFIFSAGLALMVGAVLFGTPVNGSSRWILLGPISLQPSELVKPAFVVLVAWFFAEGAQRRDVPGNLMAFLLFAAFALALVMQPDLGQTMLITVVWGAMFFMAGMPIFWVMIIAAVAVGGIIGAYFIFPHVADRVDRFLDPSTGDTFQVDTAREAILHGGWLGTGPGEGTVKRILPDAHTDFIFAVAAEEFGILACILLVALFALIVGRGLGRAMANAGLFERLAVSGLVTLIGVQAGINMAVNVGLLPAKGMTLPFISYGGSSLMSVALAMGFVLALTRRQPGQGGQDGQIGQSGQSGQGVTGGLFPHR